ncbi:MAG: flagellar basal body rod protein FlgB, partial [Alphaproteobacteria bacterium]|nr:flagellar basal body rod protein FlgB [Alphaproteobacteria bacterium]
MLDTPAIMRLSQAMARHAAQRQVVISQNVANADTPGYRARDVASFGSYLQQSGAMDSVRSGHLQDMPPARLSETADTTAPNGNSVSLEREMMRAAETRQSHDM